MTIEVHYREQVRSDVYFFGWAGKTDPYVVLKVIRSKKNSNMESEVIN